MDIITSLVIGDLSPEGIRSVTSNDPEFIRKDLILFHNQAVEDGGLEDDVLPIPDTADLDTIIQQIREQIGRAVVIKEGWLVQ